MAQAIALQEAPEKAPSISFDMPEKGRSPKKVTPPTATEAPKAAQPATPPLLEKPKAHWPKYLLFGILGLLIGAALGVLALKFL